MLGLQAGKAPFVLVSGDIIAAFYHIQMLCTIVISYDLIKTLHLAAG